MSESNPETPPDESVAAQAPAGPRCRSCGTPLVDGQEWCLECGSARTQNRWRAGRRPLLLTAGITISLLGVAVAASYAAIVDSPPVVATATVPAPPPQIATVPAAPAPTTTSAEVTPVDTTTDPSFPDTSSDTPAPVETPAAPLTPSDSGGSTGGTTTTTKTTTTDTTSTTTTPTLTPITLPDSAAALYDPLSHQLAPDGGDPAGALGDDSSAWIVQTDPALPSMDVGLLLTLPKKSTVSEVTFSTSTPGFTIQVFGSFESDIPVDVNDSRWAFLRTRKDVDGDSKKDGNTPGDGEERISLPDDGSKYKLILLWLTKPPTSGPPAKLSSVQLSK